MITKLDLDFRHYIHAGAGITSVIFSVVIWEAMTAAEMFLPTLRLGEGTAIVSLLRPIFWMLVIAHIHAEIQRRFTKNRPKMHELWVIRFDYITSFAPAFFALLALVVMLLFRKPSGGYAWWFYYLEAIYAMIVFFAIRDDIRPTLDFHFKKGNGQRRAPEPIRSDPVEHFERPLRPRSGPDEHVH